MLVHQALQQDSQRDESEIAIDHTRARLVLEIEPRDRTCRAIRLVLREHIERSPRRQSRRMRQQLTDSDHLFVSAIEFRQVMRNGAVERQLAQLDETRAEQRRDEWFRE